LEAFLSVSQVSFDFDLLSVVTEVRVTLEADGAGGIQLAPIDPRNDIFVEVTVDDITGPCSDNLVAEFEDLCENTKEDWGRELSAVFQDQLGVFFNTVAMSSTFTGLIAQAEAIVGTGDILGVFFKEEGSLVVIRGSP
jgi:hypothetical protein